MPRVSIIVPLYNKAPYILRTLESIAAQSITDFEVIVVDDGSTDGSAELVRNFPDARFRLVRQSNAGPGAARNRGLREASAPYVAFVDADDIWLPEFLDRTVALLELHGAVAAIGCGWFEYPSGAFRAKRWRARGIPEGLMAISPETTTELVFAILGYLNPSTVLARSKVLRRWGGFYERHCLYGEDMTLWLKVLLNEPWYFDFSPLVKLDFQASQLCRNYVQARPIEPFLLDPVILRNACPQALLPLLERLLKTSACKTAAVLGYWGKWRQARQLMTRFITLRDWRTRLFFLAVLSSTPIIIPIAWLARRFVHR
jgi:glycosyltransferase involved in cell wall biosynthesis